MIDSADTTFEQLPLAAKRRIDAVCARFEQAWREGKPKLEVFLESEVSRAGVVGTGSVSDRVEQAVLLAELLHIEVEFRRWAGESPRAGEYLERFPGWEAVIREVLPAGSSGTVGRGDTPGPLGTGGLGTGSGSPSPSAAGGRVEPTGQPNVFVARGPVQVPGYEILEEIGRGGMGVVYRARHVRMNRLVALKFILSGGQASNRDQKRFRQEAEAVARLRHPNIVQIYDTDEVHGQLWIALEYAEGGTLRDRLAGAPIAPVPAAKMLEALARAVQHAHRHGVVHRDLKPANVLLIVAGDSIATENRPLPEWKPFGLDLPRSADSSPPISACTPKLTDFGLAKILDRDASRLETELAAGTPSYMAPEQATGTADNDPLVDIWALGATLYELLTGRPPFRAATAIETLRLVLDADPIPPRQLDMSVPRDLETICLKCLEKEPGKRYPGARELAEDLRRYLAGEPIQARPLSRLGYAVRWARRQPGTAALVALLAFAILGMIGGLGGGMLLAMAGQQEARREKELAREEHESAERNAKEAETQRLLAEKAQLESRRLLAELLLLRAGTLGEQGRPDDALHTLAEGIRQAPPDNPGLMRVLRTNLTAWREHAHPLLRILAVEEDLVSLAVAPDGRTLYTGSLDRRSRRRDLITGESIGPDWFHAHPVRFFAFSPDGRRVLVGESASAVAEGPGIARFYDAGSGEKQADDLTHASAITDGLFLPDGKEVLTASADGVVRRWSINRREPLATYKHPWPAVRMALSADGKTLAVGLADAGRQRGAVHLWDLTADRPAPGVLPHPGAVETLAFHPNGRALYTGCSDGRVRFWEVGSHRAEVRGQSDLRMATPSHTLWHPGAVRQLELTPDGRCLLTATAERVVRLWDLYTGRPLAWFRGGTSRFALAGGRLVLPATGEVRVHALARPASRPVPRAEPLTGRAAAGAVVLGSEGVAYLPDGNRVVVAEQVRGRQGGLARLRDVNTDAPVGAPWLHQGIAVTGVLLAPGRGVSNPRVATLSGDPGKPAAVTIWEVATGKVVTGPFGPAAGVSAWSFTHDGRRLLIGDRRGSLSLWDAETGKPAGPEVRVGFGEGSLPNAIRDEVDHDAGVTALAVSADGRWVAVALAGEGGRAPAVWLYDASRLQKAGEPLPHPDPVRQLAFCPRGQTLVALGRSARLWQVASRKGLSSLAEGRGLGREASRVPSDIEEVTAVAFTADGTGVFLGASDGSVRRLDTRTGDATGPVQHLPGQVGALALSPDGRQLAVAGRDGCAWLFDVGDRLQPLGPPWVQAVGLVATRFAPDGRSILTTQADGTTRRWPVPLPQEGSPDEITRLVEWLTGRKGREMEDGRLPMKEWQKMRPALPSTLPSSEGWHDARAADAAQDGDLFAARWHIDALLRLRPKDGHLYARRALIYARAGNYSLALRDHEQAAGGKTSELVVQWHNGLASCQALGEWRAALWYLGQLLKERPSDARLLKEQAEAQRHLDVAGR